MNTKIAGLFVKARNSDGAAPAREGNGCRLVLTADVEHCAPRSVWGRSRRAGAINATSAVLVDAFVVLLQFPFTDGLLDLGWLNPSRMICMLCDDLPRSCRIRQSSAEQISRLAKCGLGLGAAQGRGTPRPVRGDIPAPRAIPRPPPPARRLEHDGAASAPLLLP